MKRITLRARTVARVNPKNWPAPWVWVMLAIDGILLVLALKH